MTQLAPLRRGNSTLCSITVGPRSKKLQLKISILHPFSINNGPHDVFLTNLLFLYPGPSCSLFFYQLTTCTFAELASPFSCMVFSWLLNSLSPERCTQSTELYTKRIEDCVWLDLGTCKNLSSSVGTRDATETRRHVFLRSTTEDGDHIPPSPEGIN